MNFYDKIHELTRSFKETEEYKKYIELKNRIKLNEDDYSKLKEFKEKQAKQQVEYMTKGNADEATQKELENLYSILVQKEDIRKLLENEMRLNIMLADMQKIMGETVKEIVEF